MRATSVVAHAPLPVAAGETINPNAPVGINPATGYARNFVAADLFAGFNSLETVNNSSGEDGDMGVSTESGSRVLPVTGAVAASVGSAVYSTAAGVYDLTSTTDTQIGVVECCVERYNATKCLVRIKTYRD